MFFKLFKAHVIFANSNAGPIDRGLQVYSFVNIHGKHHTYV